MDAVSDGLLPACRELEEFSALALKTYSTLGRFFPSSLYSSFSFVSSVVCS